MYNSTPAGHAFRPTKVCLVLSGNRDFVGDILQRHRETLVFCVSKILMIAWQVQRAHETMRKLQTAWTDECKMDSQYNAGSICHKWLLDGADSTTARWAHNCCKMKRLSLPNLRQLKERLTEVQEGLIDTRPAQSECKIDITEYNRAKRPNARWFQEQCSLETSKIVSRCSIS